MIRLMIVDDQKILLEGLVKIFEGQSHIEVVSALPFSELVEPVCDQLHPDAILLDICMEGKNSGIILAKRLKECKDPPKIIIMTGFQDISFLEMARSAGADSFIYKESTARKFMDCLEKTMAGEHIFPDVRGQVTFGIQRVTLTDRELDILRLVCRNLSYKEIADELHISIRTVSFHVSNMLRKTGHKSLIGLAVEAVDKGYAPGIRK